MKMKNNKQAAGKKTKEEWHGVSNNGRWMASEMWAKGEELKLEYETENEEELNVKWSEDEMKSRQWKQARQATKANEGTSQAGSC
jgi:hypothetical protein